jgi:hydrogenase expression/formation protein HypD
MAVHQAAQEGLRNFSILVSQVLVPPAIEAVLTAPGTRVQAFLAAGHVCTVMGWEEYRPLAAKYRVPIVVTGFEPVDHAAGHPALRAQLEEGRHEVENAYARAVRQEGNRTALEMIRERLHRGAPQVARPGGDCAERAGPAPNRMPPSTPPAALPFPTGAWTSPRSASAASCCRA